MHELTVAEALLKTIDGWQKEHGGTVIRAKVAVGRLSGVDKDALEFAWPVATANCDNPFLKDCVLEIELMPFKFQCRKCEKVSTLEKFTISCPVCGEESLVRHGGRELILQNIEVENV